MTGVRPATFPVRVGLDGGCWLNRRGYGRYARGLLKALARRDDGDRYVLFVDPETAREPDLPESFEKVVVPTRQPASRAASASGRRDLLDLWRMGRAVARYPLDVFFFPSVYTFFPLLRSVPVVLGVHDVIAEHHPRMVFPRRRHALFWRLKVAVALRQARLILTVSEDARLRILDRFHLERERVRVILEAPDPVFRRLESPRDPADLVTERGLPRGARYLLYVGGLSPHKNLPTLIEAYRRLVAERDFEALRLLLVGDYERDVFHSEYSALRALVERHGLEKRVFFTGFLPDDSLVDLYNRAEILVLPSLEEGFGLPAVEAAACGTPVVASDVGPVGALLGKGALTFPPEELDALVSALRALLLDPGRRRAMGDEGRRRAAALSWDRAADQARELWREAARV